MGAPGFSRKRGRDTFCSSPPGRGNDSVRTTRTTTRGGRRRVEVITPHINADFDTIASMMAARKLYPDAVLVLPGSKEETVKGFLLQSALYSLEMKKLREIDLDKGTRLIFVAIRNSSRIGPFRDLIGKPGVGGPSHAQH